MIRHFTSRSKNHMIYVIYLVRKSFYELCELDQCETQSEKEWGVRITQINGKKQEGTVLYVEVRKRSLFSILSSFYLFKNTEKTLGGDKAFPFRVRENEEK